MADEVYQRAHQKAAAAATSVPEVVQELLSAWSALPEPDNAGNYPAVAYARATIARNIIKDRVKAGLTQRKLAELAGIRFETLCRIETGKHTPSVATIDSIDRVLKRALKRAER